MSTLRVLLLEDNSLDADVVGVLLAEGGLMVDMQVVETRAEFESALATETFNLILADYALPNFDGLSALDIAQEQCPEVPFVLVSGCLGEELAIDALKHGATDYVLKQRLERLVPCVQRALREAQERRDRQVAEMALQALEAKYRALFHEMDEGYCIAEILLNDRGDPVDYRILEANPRFEQLTALSLEEALSGRTIREIAPELEEHWYQRYGSVALTGESIRFEQRAAGWNRWYDVYAFRIGEPENRHVAILFNDISDRKSAELALQQQIRQEYLLADIAQEIRQSLELDQVLHTAVERVRDWLACDRVILFQFRPNWQGDVVMESVGDGWTALQFTAIGDPCFVDRFIQPYRQGHVSVLNDINQPALESCYVDLLQQFQVQASLAVPILQGETLWGLLIAHQCAAPRQWQSSEIAILQRLAIQIGIAVQQSELYAQVRSELAAREQIQGVLEESEARLQAILDYSPAIIYLLDAENRHLLANHSYAEQLATTPENLAGKTLHEVWPAEVADGFATQNRIVLETGQLLQVEDTAPLADGLHSYLTIKFPLFDATGTPYALCGISTDITERKALEAQFYHSQWLENLGTLAGGVAHDLNNVLTPILTMAQVLRLTQPGLDGKGREQLNLIELSAKRGAKLVKQILAVTRAADGDRIPVDPIVLLQQEIEIMQQSFPKSIQICVDLPPADPTTSPLGTILIDPTYLHQIILNLCINARDAMPEGGTLTLSATRVFVDQAMAAQSLDARVGPYAVITLTDTGGGIPPDIQERMFNPFFTTKAPDQGTGLGLATVHALVKANDGFLQVISDVGQGTEFQVYFPLVTGDSPDLDVPSVSLANDSSPPGATVLVVEDEDLVREMLRSLLESHQYRILLAQDGATALELYQQHQGDIQLIVTDIMMPILDGLTLIETLRGLNAELPIIAFSGISGHEESALALGANYFLAKPFDAETLLHQMAIALKAPTG